MRSVLFIFLSATLFAQNGPQHNQAEVERVMIENVRRSTTPVERQEVQNYVEELGKRLDGSGVPNTFSAAKVYNNNALHEPYALPDGSILIPVALLLTANDEAEFAGMLSQSIARGPFRCTCGIAGITDRTLVESFGSGILLPTVLINQWREKELQADAAAVRSMSRAGFDPSALLRYIERVQPPDSPSSKFPARADRIAALQKAIEELAPAVYSQSDEFYTIQEYVRPTPPSAPSDPDGRPTLKRKPVSDN